MNPFRRKFKFQFVVLNPKNKKNNLMIKEFSGKFFITNFVDESLNLICSEVLSEKLKL
jgi:hypothetical protein